MERLLASIAPIAERSMARADDSVPTRMFRVAGLFQEYGASALILKPCLHWLDMWRTGSTPFSRELLDLPSVESGGHYPFALVSDSTLSFRPSDVVSRAKKTTSKDHKNLTQ
eukprot:3027483-Alexandrium_andersonii.AAC.1